MHDPQRPPQLESGRRRGSSPGLLKKILAVAAGALVLIGAVAISFVVFVVVLTALLVFGLYVWWKTRPLRRHIEEQLNAQRPDSRRGETIEGEVLHKRDSDPPPR